MIDDYRDYKDRLEEKSSFWTGLNTKVIVIFCVLLFATILILYYYNISIKYSIPFVIIVVIMIFLVSKSRTGERLEYIGWKVAREILRNDIKEYTELRKRGIRISLPRGDAEWGEFTRIENPRQYDIQEWLYWELGFKIYDEDDNHNPKYFMGKVDAVLGGIGTMEISSLEEEYKPPKTRYIYKDRFITTEKYIDMDSKGLIPK